MPKGGYLVDFEKRVTPKLKRIMAKESGTLEVQGECMKKSVDAPSSECMALVVWNGSQLPAEGSAIEYTRKEADVKAKSPPKTHWTPPGCLKRQLWKRPASWTRSVGKKSQHTDDKAAVTVDDGSHARAEEYEKLKEERCSLEKEREKLAGQQGMAQRKMIQAESLMSKCSREMKEFEAYKVGVTTPLDVA